ncbi:MAG: beta-phosphoglucomutase [Clostridia bacterium]|jgi:beta-phosphoglucomutase|nr:beta-phosphoglucomutase [Clostridia bacterium]MBT7123452.1 beta-phosphoglucomutase [Clostridia bacterium]
MKYKAVILDLDGVICHTDQYHYEAWRTIADELGIIFNEDINNRLRGVGRMQSFDIILENYDKAMSEDEKLFYTDKKNSIYVDLLHAMTPLDVDPDVMSTLSAIRARGIKMAIGSSSQNAKMILHKIGLFSFFEAISDGTNITRTKPDPEVFLLASEYLDIDPPWCIVVEDAKAGVDAAKSVNMDCAAIGDAADYAPATYSLGKLSDLLKYL